ncbi:ATP-binding cassette sub-family A member 10-like [Hyposmocoma kahamanoa]|uniref:ATP-binding cassette sub-family A member 10-like n=1 Tax=Hyposmocoma kahamanoa TaxID=1477025 RepID=UPI000E6D7579|nr:ATP-binding cassette sub-family A member 10-like [Hyposmocoma kahamanoa]
MTFYLVFHGLRHSTTALDNIDLDIYRGEITMLLGVNGAGKSTLLSIIAGMNSPTSGTVYVNGLDTSTRIQEISKDVGFCPQNNVTFNFLTVRENIMFFERLRGKGMGTSAEMYMDKLDLTPKADLHSDQIDAGRKRCLQVACALVGDAEVLVLDEPTSNMDSNLRHALWDCLLLLRGEKTIFIATTVMEEADALGDRIALLSHGKVKCHGSPAFLKDAIGADFKLNVTMKTHRKPSNAHQIVKVLEDVIPDTTTSMTHSKQDLSKLSICLPAKARDMFPKVFDALEYRRHELGISSISVGVSMEEVFLRFVEEDDSEIGIYDEEQLDHYENMDAVTSYTLWLQQMITLMGRTWAFVRTNKVKFLILEVRDVYGYSIESKRTVIYYPNPSHRTLSRAMNTFSNIYMSLIMPYAPDYGINVSHVPLKEILRNDHGHWEPKKVFLCNAWATWVSFLITTTLPHFILLAVQEYYTGVRFRHMTAGCSSFIIWYSKMAIHLSIYSLVIPPSLLFAARVLDADETISRPDFLGAIFIFLLAFGPACLMHLYALSFLLNPEHIIAQINIMTLFLMTQAKGLSSRAQRTGRTSHRADHSAARSAHEILPLPNFRLSFFSGLPPASHKRVSPEGFGGGIVARNAGYDRAARDTPRMPPCRRPACATDGAADASKAPEAAENPRILLHHREHPHQPFFLREGNLYRYP